MQAIVVKAIGRFELTNVPKPSPRSGEVLIEVAVAGFCRTDLKIIEVGHRDLVLPRIPAEEVVGTVCDCGSPEDRHLIGKRVYVYPGTSCGFCIPCKNGAENLCAEMRIMGFHRDGGFAQYVVSPVASILEIHGNTSFEQAVFAEPLSCCLNALELSQLKKGETIAIWGGGPAGTLLSRAALAIGANVVVIETDERRRKLIQGLSCVPDEMFDVAIVAAGSCDAYEQAIRHLNLRGRLIVFSGLAPDNAKQSIDLNQLHYNEQSVTGAYGCSYRHGEQALKWISEAKVVVTDMISHRLPLRELSQALNLVRNRLGMKILLYPNGMEGRDESGRD